MKILIQTTTLNRAVQTVNKAVTARTTIPILSGIKFEVSTEGIRLTASDTEVSIQTFIPTHIEEKEVLQITQTGQVVLPAKFFAEIIKKMPEEHITIEVNENFQTKLSSGKAEIQMIGLDPEEFPILPVLSKERMFRIQSDLLKTMIRQTVYAVSMNEATPILTGVLWDLAQKTLKFTATDRHRLSTREAEVDADDTLSFHNIVIAGKSLNELQKILPDQSEWIDIVVSDNQVLFKIGYDLFYTRILEGAYPDTSKIIPQTFRTEFVIDTKQLMEAMDRAYLLSREEKTNIVHLMTQADGGLEITSSSSELGKAKEEIAVTSFEGEALKISFNSKYMLDALKVVDSKEIFLGFTGTMSPIILKPQDHDHSLQLILPYRSH